MESNELKLSRQILDILSRVFPPSGQTHGLDHAIEVEKLALEIAKEPEFSNIPLNMMVLRAAALLHDVGHSKAVSSWTSSRVEHVKEGIKIAQEALTTIPPFDRDGKRLEQVLYLIRNHDVTNYSFPIKTQDGKPVQKMEEVMPPSFLNEVSAMLAILREADSRTATGKKGAERTLEYSLSRGIPPFASKEGNPLNAWMWEESAVGNVRLAAKRALLDAYTTQTDKEFAWRGYLEAEEVVKAFCEHKGVIYEKELCLEVLKDNMGRRDVGFQIREFKPWDELVKTLRKVELWGDPELKPYRSARIQSKLIECERLVSLSRYVLSTRLGIHSRLRNLFLENYALDPFDLAGMVFVQGEEDRRKHYTIAPPIVEISEPDGGVLTIVDGLHRCCLAKSLGLSKIRVVLISNVPAHLPLPALPLSWEEVKEFVAVPEMTQKRKFRYPNPYSFPDISWFSSATVTEENCLYFFYRNLTQLSSSIRPAVLGSDISWAVQLKLDLGVE